MKKGILDIIAEETGGERQYSTQYAISYKGSHYAHRQQRKPLTEYRVEFESENFVIVEAENEYEAERLAEAARPDETVWSVSTLEQWEADYCE